MIRRAVSIPLLALLLAAASGAARAQQEIRFWHAMGGPLGDALETLVSRFNASQSQYRVVAEHKGSYEDTMIAALAAQRAGDGPALVQVSEAGTEHMMAARRAVRPLWQLMAEEHERLDAAAFLPAVASYFADRGGRLLALPFNLATPILFYNKDAFRKAGLDPDRPPRTWYEMPKMMGALASAGYSCPFTTTWPAWVQVENMSAWHNQDFATRENGMEGMDAKLTFNTLLMMRHISVLGSWARAGYFSYSGRRVEGERRFAKGECAMLTAASSSAADLRREAGFDFGVGQFPYYDDIPGAPQNTLIGGGGIWVLAGRKSAEYRGAAKFLAWLTQTPIQAEWAERTGYVPLTEAAYEAIRAQGFYDVHPGYEIAIRQLKLRRPTPDSRGIRLGRLEAIREIVDRELEGVWSDKVPPKVALDRAVAEGDALLRAFEAEHRAGREPGVPRRVPRGHRKK
ncbi:MAG TPA: sn-glycerol-3-phosphate ABC transporter substrate-binding protein UgpB [Burkholderiales bacterium]|nr:sn-glycerol-3-phosphate ABC transporter substrate-binding protein UgpB [Burkholderiales bacterium]